MYFIPASLLVRAVLTVAWYGQIAVRDAPVSRGVVVLDGRNTKVNAKEG